MPETRGGPQKRKQFEWQYDVKTGQVTITGETGKVHVYGVHEITTVLRCLQAHFGTGFFPLANDVQRLQDGTERMGLGRILLQQRPGDT